VDGVDSGHPSRDATASAGPHDDFNAQLGLASQRLDQINERLRRVEHGRSDLGKLMQQLAVEQTEHGRFHDHHVDRRVRRRRKPRARSPWLQPRT
jgi:hypothetical protein